MKVELIKKTTKIFAKEYFYISVDGDNLISETWTSDPVKADEYFIEYTEKAKQHPVEIIEVIKTVEI